MSNLHNLVVFGSFLLNSRKVTPQKHCNTYKRYQTSTHYTQLFSQLRLKRYKLIRGDSGVITGSIARSASRRYLIYSEADFEVFRSAGATRCTDGVKFGTEPPCQISPPSVQRQGRRTPKSEILLRFDQNVEYKRPAGAQAYPLRDFLKQNLQSLYPVTGCVSC